MNIALTPRAAFLASVCMVAACTGEMRGNGEGGASGSAAGAGGGGGSAGGSAGHSGPQRVMFGLDSLVPNDTCVAIAMATDAIPAKLSETGCVQKDDPREPAAGVIPFNVASPLWSDGAIKRRFLALPKGKTIKVLPSNDWDLPIGTTLMKSFELAGQMLETRFLVRLKDGSWFGYTYQWPEGGGNDATLLGPDLDNRFVGDVDWLFPSRANCLGCHTEAAGRSLGLETAQLNADFVYPGNKQANQLATLDHLGLFEKPIGDPARLPALPNPVTATNASKEERARSYLHANCSHCHRPGGEKETSLDLLYSTASSNTKICNTVPSKTTYSIPGAMLLTPGHPEQSIISVRMHSRIASVRMPAFGTSVVDTEGVGVVDDWINSMSACP